MIASCKNNLIYGFAIICQSSLAGDMTTRWIIILVGMEDLLLAMILVAIASASSSV